MKPKHKFRSTKKFAKQYNSKNIKAQPWVFQVIPSNDLGIWKIMRYCLKRNGLKFLLLVSLTV